LTNIASGETFSENSNYESVTIANALPRVGGTSISVTTSTTLSKVGTLSYPSGWKIITVRALFLNSEPQEMFLANVGDSFPSFGNTQKVAGFTQGALVITVLTNATNIDVWAKYSSSGQNPITSDYVMLV
jgi:hypothetical protein